MAANTRQPVSLAQPASSTGARVDKPDRSAADRRRFLQVGAAALAAAVVPLGRLAASRGAQPARADGAGQPDTRAPRSARFLHAVAAGDEPAVRRMLAEDPGLVHMRDATGRSAFAIGLLARHETIPGLLTAAGYRPDLHEAAAAHDWERFDELAVAAPGLVNQPHPVGGTAMYAAAIGGAGTDVWRVYRYSAAPDARSGPEAPTALRAAFEHPDLQVVELTAASLVGNGADPNAPQPGGDSALHAAARRGSVPMVEVLIRKHARVDARDEDGRTPLDVARRAGRREAAGLLERHATIPRDCMTSRTAYDASGAPYVPADLSSFSALERERIVGASHFRMEEVREAIERHPVLAHAVATTTEITVEACAHTGRNELVDYLLDKGAPYSVPTAAMRNDLPRLRALLDQDPDRVHERGAHDFPLLWYSVIGKGSIDVAELLLARGAEVERQHWLGTTALHWAAGAGETEMVRLFVDHGADVNRPGLKFGGEPETPLQIAQRRDRPAVVKLLRERGARG